MLYSNVAGREHIINDQNFGSAVTPEAITVLVIGTADRGPSNIAYTVTDQSIARALYGDDGTLIQGMFEALDAGAPLVKLYRIGGTSASLSGIASAITVTTVEHGEGIEDEYAISWIVNDAQTDGTIRIWRVNSNGTTTLVYQRTMSNALPTVDYGQISVIVSGTIDYTEDEFGTSSVGILMSELDDSVSGGMFPLTAGTSQLDPTRQELYELLHEAYYVLFNEQFDFVNAMDIYLDDYNIADKTSTQIQTWLDEVYYPGLTPAVPEDEQLEADAAMANSTILNAYLTYAFNTTDALLYASYEQDEDGVFNWTWTGVKSTDQHEVNFAYQLANFCHQMTRNEIMCHGVIGVKPPVSFSDQASINRWIGELPTYSDDDPDTILSNGSGLLGNKFMAGTVAKPTGYFWATESEYLDDAYVMADRNGNDIDIGRHLSVFADWLYMVNRYAAIINPTTYSYLTTGATTYCGFIASLDAKDAPTNKALPGGGRVPYRVALAKVDDLVLARYVAMRPRPGGHRVARGSTAARWGSDYKEFSTFNIIKRVDDEVRKVVFKYIGKAFDTYMRESMQTDLNEVGKRLRSAGYIKGQFEFKPVATPLQAANGQLLLFTTVTPAFELVRVTNVTSIMLQ